MMREDIVRNIKKVILQGDIIMEVISNKKIRRSFIIHQDLYIQLKVYAIKRKLAYSTVLDGIIATYLKDPSLFNIDFNDHK